KTFRQKCREYAAKQVAGQKQDFVRLGVVGDWDNPYLTMDFKFEADIIRALGKIAENGHLHKGFKPVYWSVVGGSALAEAEVEYHDKTSFAIDVRFAVADKDGFLAPFGAVPDAVRQQPLSLVIWTTTPWTLPSNQAVSLHAELDYALVSCNLSGQPETLLLAAAMVEDVMQRYGCEDYTVVASSAGA